MVKKNCFNFFHRKNREAFTYAMGISTPKHLTFLILFILRGYKQQYFLVKKST